jgi:hypothetical protein
MKTNLSITAAQVDAARKPEVGVESGVWFAPESCILLGTVEASAAAVGTYTSAGGAGIPTGGRDVVVRCASQGLSGVPGSAMTVKFNVVYDDDAPGTATATFHIPTYTPTNVNKFPLGIVADLVPDNGPDAAKKIKTVTSLNAVANQVPGNQFQIWTTPNDADFVFIDCTTSKAGQFKLPSVISIPCGYDGAAYTKFGRSEPKPLNIGFRDRGPLEQLNRFNGHTGTIRIDVKKDGYILMNRILYSGFRVAANGDRSDGDEVLESKAEGTYEQFFIGYARAA